MAILSKYQNESKKIYKNWKIYAITLGIIVLGAGAGLAVYYTTHNNNQPIIEESPTNDQDVVDAIATANYQLTVQIDSDVVDVNNQINSEFIEEQLKTEIKTIFKRDLFKFNQITIGNQKLKNSDLNQLGTIITQINYNYDSITNQNTTLTIKIDGIDDQQIVNVINKLNYQITTAVNSLAGEIKITSDFIKEQLNEEIKTVFDGKLFQFKEIRIGNRKLQDRDLTTSGIIYTLIAYNYGSITNQTTSLAIEVTGIDDQQIVKAINQTSYQIEVAVNSFANQIKITSNFIKEKLTGEIAKAFANNWFQFKEITIDNRKLQDRDLTTSGIIYTLIAYNYGSITNQTTTLTIKVTGIDNKQIVNAINQTNYQINTEFNNQVKNINLLITSNFIKERLNSEIKNAFNSALFKFNQITINGRNLQDSDLTKAQTITTKINYDYGSMVNQETILIITITINHQQIAEAISNQTYQIETSAGKKYQELSALITSDFIKAKLPTNIQNAFDSNLFTKQAIINLKTNQALTDQDLAISGILNLKLIYNYGFAISYSCQLTINLTPIYSDQQIVDQINNTGWYMWNFMTSHSATNRLQQLKAEFKERFYTEQEPDIQERIKKYMIITKIIKENGQELTEEDLKERFYLKNVTFKYDFNQIKNQSFVLEELGHIIWNFSFF
ncbi:MAG: hypothetical protein REH79_00155 [Spiroplasma sp.]|nr:hypothetical protein [Spiroplasma sp.]